MPQIPSLRHSYSGIVLMPRMVGPSTSAELSGRLPTIRISGFLSRLAGPPTIGARPRRDVFCAGDEAGCAFVGDSARDNRNTMWPSRCRRAPSFHRRALPSLACGRGSRGRDQARRSWEGYRPRLDRGCATYVHFASASSAGSGAASHSRIGQLATSAKRLRMSISTTHGEGHHLGSQIPRHPRPGLPRSWPRHTRSPMNLWRRHLTRTSRRNPLLF